MTQCKAQVTRYMGNWPQSGQCSRRATVGDYCKQHDPAVVEARKADSSAKYEKAWQHRRLEIRGPAFYEILTLIANGHNDPRRLALDAINEYKSGVKK